MAAVTIHDFARKKAAGSKISMITCYDATFARLIDQSAIDAVLVGDSLGNVIQGHPNTLAVTVDDVVYHCRAVTRAAERVHVVADMPLGAYQVCDDDAVRNAIRLVKEGRAGSVKLEGGASVVPANPFISSNVTPASLNAPRYFSTSSVAIPNRRDVKDTDSRRVSNPLPRSPPADPAMSNAEPVSRRALFHSFV